MPRNGLAVLVNKLSSKVAFAVIGYLDANYLSGFLVVDDAVNLTAFRHLVNKGIGTNLAGFGNNFIGIGRRHIKDGIAVLSIGVAVGRGRIALGGVVVFDGLIRAGIFRSGLRLVLFSLGCLVVCSVFFSVRVISFIVIDACGINFVVAGYLS